MNFFHIYGQNQLLLERVYNHFLRYSHTKLLPMATFVDEQSSSFHSQNLPLSEKCTLAHEVIKAKLPKLIEKIPPEEISDELWSASIISEEEYDFSFDKSKTRKERTRKLIRKVMEAVKKNYEVFERFCYVLEQSENKGIQEWSKRLKGQSL